MALWLFSDVVVLIIWFLVVLLCWCLFMLFLVVLVICVFDLFCVLVVGVFKKSYSKLPVCFINWFLIDCVFVVVISWFLFVWCYWLFGLYLWVRLSISFLLVWCFWLFGFYVVWCFGVFGYLVVILLVCLMIWFLHVWCCWIFDFYMCLLCFWLFVSIV